MGSKRKTAGRFYSAIKNYHPNANCLVDLFCGGFAISEYFLKKGWEVIANDKNGYIIALIRKLLHEDLNEKEILQFISRDKFWDVLKTPSEYPDWYVGYVMCCWSFGNNQKSYLYGRNLGNYPLAIHNLAVNKDPVLITQLDSSLPDKYIKGVFSLDSWQKRRIAWLKIEDNFALQQKCSLVHLKRNEVLLQMKALQHESSKCYLFNSSYESVNIPKGAIVYCDPPYQGTAKYAESNFDHAKFWDWARKQSQNNPVYVSEYSAPPDFETILEFSQASGLCLGQSKNQPNEKLFRLKTK